MTSTEKEVRDYIKRNLTKEQILDCSAQTITMNILFGYSPFNENYSADIGDLDEESGEYYDELYLYVQKVKKEIKE